MQLPAEILEKLVVEIGLDDEFLMTKVFNEMRSNGDASNIVNTTNSLILQLKKSCCDQGWINIRSSLVDLVQDIFPITARLEALKLHAKKFQLEHNQGRKCIQKIEIQKYSNQELEINKGDIFYIDETSPRKYAAIENYEFNSSNSSEIEVVEIYVKAIEIGTKYNASAGQIKESERVLLIEDITNTEIITYGAEIEDVEDFRDRYLAAERGMNSAGVKEDYIDALKSHEYVIDATFDEVDPVDGTMYFTIYGDDGLSEEDRLEAQELLDAELNFSDKAVVSLPKMQTLDLSIKVLGEYNALEIETAVKEFIKNLDRGSYFFASPIQASIMNTYSTIQAIDISPSYSEIETGYEFFPTITIEDYAT